MADSMIECHLSVMSQQTTTATNQASVMHAVIHAWYMSGLISRSVYIAIANSGPRGPRYIGALLYRENKPHPLAAMFFDKSRLLEKSW